MCLDISPCNQKCMWLRPTALQNEQYFVGDMTSEKQKLKLGEQVSNEGSSYADIWEQKEIIGGVL